MSCEVAVEVKTGAVSVRQAVSDVPGDTLAELIPVLTRLVRGSNSECVEWSLEPARWLWEFAIDGNEVRLRVAGGDGADFEVRLEKDAALRVLCRALLRLAADPFWRRGDASEQWSWPFPERALEVLRQLVLER